MPILTKAVFIDTSVWIYRFNSQDKRFPTAAKIVDQALMGEFPAFISDQVLREIYAVVSNPKKVDRPLSSKECHLYFKGILTSKVTVLFSNEKVLRYLMMLMRRHAIPGRQIHDANIAATMLANKIPWLLTENTADFSLYPKIHIVNPFEE